MKNKIITDSLNFIKQSQAKLDVCKKPLGFLAYVFVFILIFTLFATFTSALLTDNLIAYYTYDEGTGNSAVSSNGVYNSTVINPNWNTTCKSNACLFFNDSRNTYANVSTFIRPNYITVSAWINIKQYNTTTGIIVGMDDVLTAPSERTFQFYIDASGHMGAVIFNNSASVDSLVTSVVLLKDRWYFVAVTYNGVNVTHYLNGSYVSSKAVSNPGILRNGTGMAVSRVSDTTEGTNGFQGYIDEVGIWNTALSKESISELYRNGSYLSYPFIVPNSTIRDINFSAKNIDNQSVIISNYSLEFNDNGTIYTTTNGTIYVDDYNYSKLLNITFFDSPNYYDKNFTDVNMSSGMYTLLVANIYNLYYVNNTLISPCNITVTQNNTGAITYFNFTKDASIIETKIFAYLNPYMSTYLVNDTGNYSLINLTHNTYWLLFNNTNNDSFNGLFNTSCSLNVCVNDWVRITQPCISNLRYINYTDSHSCPLSYYPSDTGNYEDCASTATTDRNLWLIIILLVIWIIGLILALSYQPLIMIPVMITSFALAYYMSDYFDTPIISLGVIVISAFMFFVAIKYNNRS